MCENLKTFVLEIQKIFNVLQNSILELLLLKNIELLAC